LTPKQPPLGLVDYCADFGGYTATFPIAESSIEFAALADQFPVEFGDQNTIILSICNLP